MNEELKRLWEKYSDVVDGQLVTTPPEKDKPFYTEYTEESESSQKNATLPCGSQDIETFFQYQMQYLNKRETPENYDAKQEIRNIFCRSNSIEDGYKGNNVTISRESYHGYITLMCPCCFRLQTHRYDQHISTKIDALTFFDPYDENKHEKQNIIPATPTHYYVCECEFCGTKSIYFNQIDNAIASSISILNLKGFHTSYCCQGHIRKDGRIDNAYISFKNKLILPYLKHLPLGWEIDMPVYRKQDQVVIRGYFKTENEHKKILTDLSQFVSELPSDDANDIIITEVKKALFKLFKDIDEFKSIVPLQKESHATKPSDWFVGDLKEFMEWKSDQKRFQYLLSKLPERFFDKNIGDGFRQYVIMQENLRNLGMFTSMPEFGEKIIDSLGKTLFV